MMTKSPSKKRIVKPPLDRFGGIRVVQRRLKKSEVIEHNKENVAQELIDIATANIADIVWWDDHGPQLEVELHDKVSVLRTLAKASGLLESQEDVERPSVVGIVMHGPEPKIIDGEVDEEKIEPQRSGEDPSGDVKETTK